MITPPTDPDIIILGYNPMFFALSFYASLIALFIWDRRGCE